MTTNSTEKDLVAEVEELLAQHRPSWRANRTVIDVDLLRRLVDEVKALRRGEFICQRCHHRKDAEFERGDF